MLNPAPHESKLPNASPDDTGVPFDPLAPTIFHEAWWLSAATQGRATVVEFAEGGRTVGRLPFVLDTRFGLQSSNMPTLTHFLGPAVVEGSGSEQNRFQRRQSITRELIRKLPRISSFRQKMYKGMTDVLAFQAEDYSVSVQFTFEVPATGKEVIWRGMRDKTRNVIRRAEESLSVSNTMEPGEFFDFSVVNLEAQKEGSNIDFETCRIIATQCLDRARGLFWVARDNNGAVKAAIFCAWDAKSYYYLLSTRAADSGNGAIPLLVWHAIQHAASKGLVFDFDGVASSGSITLFSGFGGAVSPRYIVAKSSPLYQALRVIRRFNPEVSNPFC